MRILYLIPSLDRSGGAEQAVAAMVAPLGHRGIDVEVVTLSARPAGAWSGGGDADLARQVEEAGGRVTRLGSPGGSRPWRPVARAAALRSLVVARHPDLVHTTLFDADVVGRVAARAARTPVVSSLVNVAYGPEQRANPAVTPWKLSVVHALDRATAMLATRFHALSPHVADTMGPRLGIRAERIDVVPRGRDPATLGSPDPARRRRVRSALGVAEGRPLVVAAARHEHQKGLDVLLDAWPAVRRTHPGAELRIGGRSGSLTPALEARVAALGLDADVVLLGSRDDVPDLLVAADAFVVPSRWEGFGSILVEAMGLGAPLVASDVGPVADVVGSGWARLVPAERVDALATAVGETLDQPEAERARRAALARARFEARYTLDVVADEMAAFYARALS